MVEGGRLCVGHRTIVGGGDPPVSHGLADRDEAASLAVANLRAGVVCVEDRHVAPPNQVRLVVDRLHRHLATGTEAVNRRMATQPRDVICYPGPRKQYLSAKLR
eukprot:3117927-Prymnesium_polylepis.1